MSFADFNDEELNKTELLEEGDYDFEITKADLTTSKSSGNEMIALTLRVFGNDGSTHFVNDYLVAVPNMRWKMKQIVDCVKVSAPIKADNLVGKAGKVTIKIEPAGDFPAKNSVKTYLSSGDKAKAVSTPAPATFKPSAEALEVQEDDIPF